MLVYVFASLSGKELFLINNEVLIIQNIHLINKMMNKELNNWAEKVIADCTPILEKYKLGFYPFQAKFNKKLDILIIGLNPGSNRYDGTKEIYNEPKEVNLSIEEIFSGNSVYNEDKGNWKIYQNLMKIDFIKNLSGEFNYMNYLYFPTTKFNDIKNIKDFDVINICKTLTLDLIKIINPKIIIVLGTSLGIDTIARNTKTILNGYRKRLVVQGEIEGIKAYGIPHPSYNNFQKENEEISKVLQTLISGKDVIPYSLSRTDDVGEKVVKKKDFDIQKINEIFKKLKFQFEKFNNKDHLFKAVFKCKNNDILDFRIDIKNEYFAFRSLDKTKDAFFGLRGKENYKNLFFENAEIEKNSWLVYKTFQNYNPSQTVENQIVGDLNKLVLDN